MQQSHFTVVHWIFRQNPVISIEIHSTRSGILHEPKDFPTWIWCESEFCVCCASYVTHYIIDNGQRTFLLAKFTKMWPHLWNRVSYIGSIHQGSSLRVKMHTCEYGVFVYLPFRSQRSSASFLRVVDSRVLFWFIVLPDEWNRDGGMNGSGWGRKRRNTKAKQ